MQAWSFLQTPSGACTKASGEGCVYSMNAAALIPAFDWRRPDYGPIWQQRLERLARIRANPHTLAALLRYYADHPADFINDWGVTTDPRQKNRGLPVEMPFVLFPRQREMIGFIVDRMAAREPGIIEKSRDCGASWLVMCLGATLCLFGRGVVVGVGSSKADKVDRSGDPDCLFWKIKFFLNHLPPELRGGWEESRHAQYMRLQFPGTNSAIVGESGDDIGRSGRSTFYAIDEGAHLERPALIEASLASNTDCRIDISTPNGRANAFATKRWSGRIPVFTFGWRDDPRKDDAWYARQCELLDPVTRAQEIDLSYDASVEGILIPSEWVHAAIGAHTKLGIAPTGARRAALDVADEGRDKNALAGRHGILLEYLSKWCGKKSHIYATAMRVINTCDKHRYEAFTYDADGLGAGVRGDAVVINEQRRAAGKREIAAEPFRGSGAVFDPDGSLVEGRLNKDYFANLKAQSWWALRLRFQNTYRAVVEGLPYNADDIISIDRALPELQALLAELVQPTYSVNTVGKILVDKTPDGAMSPNLADAVMIAFSASRPGAYFAAATAAPSVEAATLPPDLDLAFAFVAFSDNAAAVIYCGTNLQRGGGAGPLYVLDWDLVEIAPTLETWLWSVPTRLEELCRAPGCRFAAARLYVDPTTETGYAELIRQREYPATPIEAILPPLEERFTRARPYVNLGLVRPTATALGRMVSFRSATRNFLREVASRAEVVETQALAIAYASAVLVTYVGRRAIPVAPALPSLPAPLAAAAAPPRQPPPHPTALLKPGRRIIDGHPVDVPPAADGRALVWFPLAAGFHIVDGIGVLVDDPRASIHIPLSAVV